MSGHGIALYTDEMISPKVADALRQRGYDAVSCHAAGRANRRISDDEQLAYAAEQGRAILTDNAVDYIAWDHR